MAKISNSNNGSSDPNPEFGRGERVGGWGERLTKIADRNPPHSS